MQRLALQSMQLFLGQITSSPEALKLSILQAIFDMLMVHENDFLGKDGGDNVRLWLPLSYSTTDLLYCIRPKKSWSIWLVSLVPRNQKGSKHSFAWASLSSYSQAWLRTSTYVLTSVHPFNDLTTVHAGSKESYHGVPFSPYCRQPGTAPMFDVLLPGVLLLFASKSADNAWGMFVVVEPLRFFLLKKP